MATTETELSRHALEVRILREGYGPGAWHGADLKAALADVSAEQAFRRPAPGRHNIAEIALHHAFCARSVRGQLSGVTPDPFVLDGEDWFELKDQRKLSWSKIKDVVAREQEQLSEVIGKNRRNALTSTVTDDERLNLVLGITCHAVYHAGQVQLIKRLQAE
jgi:hypothetical protein